MFQCDLLLFHLRSLTPNVRGDINCCSLPSILVTNISDLSIYSTTYHSKISIIVFYYYLRFNKYGYTNVVFRVCYVSVLQLAKRLPPRFVTAEEYYALRAITTDYP